MLRRSQPRRIPAMADFKLDIQKGIGHPTGNPFLFSTLPFWPG
jgi:hypothetical protein